MRFCGEFRTGRPRIACGAIPPWPVSDVPRTGQPGSVGTLVTKTLLIAGAAGVTRLDSGERGAMLRAYDKATGQEVGAVAMPAPQTGSPMTYTVDSRQFLVVAVSGSGYSGELLAFAPAGVVEARRRHAGGWRAVFARRSQGRCVERPLHLVGGWGAIRRRALAWRASELRDEGLHLVGRELLPKDARPPA